MTSNLQIEAREGEPFQDVILRAAYCPLGGTSELVVQSIETKCMSRLREMLRAWRAKFESMFPGEEWTGPDPAQCSLHRLGGGGAIISDTCNGARRSKQLLQDTIAAQVEKHVGDEAWSAMSEEERRRAVVTHKVDCWQHLRNIFLAEMSRAQVCMRQLSVLHACIRVRSLRMRVCASSDSQVTQRSAHRFKPSISSC